MRPSRRALAWASAACAVFAAIGSAAAHPAFVLGLSLNHTAHALPEGAPSAILHGGTAYDPSQPFDLVIFLHGHAGCVNVLARTGRVRCTPSSAPERGWGLAAAYDRARTNSLLFMPQLAYRERTSDPGRMREDGFARDQVREALREARARTGGVAMDRVRRFVLVAHSGGYEAAAAILAHGSLGPRVKRVVLFDALYGNTSQFLDWERAATDHSLVTIYNAGRPAEQSRLLVASARRASLRVAEQPRDLASAIRRHQVTAFHTTVAHADIPARYFRDVLRF